MSNRFSRREFLSRIWKWVLGAVAVAGAWTTWDVLQPSRAAGAGPVRTVTPEQIPDAGVLEVPEMRGYLTKVDGDFVALWWKCPHLGCKVPWCETSGQFECPCHGSVFNRVGEYRRGPAPRGMDRFATIGLEQGAVVVDISSLTLGDAPGPESIDEPPSGPECLHMMGEG